MQAKKPKPTSGVCFLLLVGLPGSGKSTFSRELRALGWTHVNQDELGTADECKKAIVKAIRGKRHVVLDRCNTMQKERKMFITEMKRECDVKHVEVVYFDTPIEVCKERVRERRNHPTLPPEMGDEVIDSFLRGFKTPESWEGFSHMYSIANSDEFKEAMSDLKARYPPAERKGAVSGKGGAAKKGAKKKK